MSGAGRIIYLDVLNVVACYCVIILHSTSKFFKPDSSPSWYFSLFLQSICICAVPIFFMLSGATLLEYWKRYSTKDFLKKRFLRIVIPFIFWSLFYAFCKVATHQLEIKSAFDLLDKLMNNEILQIFWFFYALIPIYLCIPILSLLVKYNRIQDMLFFCILGFANMGIIPLFKRFFDLNAGKFSIPIAGSALAYVGMGWLLKHEQLGKRGRYLIYLLGGLSSISIFALTAFLTHGDKETDRVFVTSTSIFSALIAISVFLFFKHLNPAIFNKSILNNALRKLSSASFGVYLVQMVVIFFIQKLPFVNEYSPLYSIFGAFAVYLICVSIVLLIKKIPVVKWIFP